MKKFLFSVSVLIFAVSAIPMEFRDEYFERPLASQSARSSNPRESQPGITRGIGNYRSSTTNTNEGSRNYHIHGPVVMNDLRGSGATSQYFNSHGNYLGTSSERQFHGESSSSSGGTNYDREYSSSLYKKRLANGGETSTSLISRKIMTNLSRRNKEMNNIYFSPISLWMVMAMLASKQEPPPVSLSELLSKASTGDRLDQDRSLILPKDLKILGASDMDSLVAIAKDYQTKWPKVFSSTNALVLREDIRIDQEYASLLKSNFDAKFARWNSGSVESAVTSLNQYVSDKTNGMINNLVNADQLLDTPAMLVNAVAFEAEWLKPFYPELTSAGEFHLENGEKMTADFMWTDSETTIEVYQEDDLFEAVRLRYKIDGGDKVAATFVVPTKGKNVGDLMEHLDTRQLVSDRTRFQVTKSRLSIPRFKIETMMDSLGPILTSDLGFQSAISFNGDPIEILQKAYLKVDEYGTSSAAATFTLYRGLSEIIRVNRPFLIYISDEQSGDVLFSGVIHRPEPFKQSDQE